MSLTTQNFNILKTLIIDRSNNLQTTLLTGLPPVAFATGQDTTTSTDFITYMLESYDAVGDYVVTFDAIISHATGGFAQMAFYINGISVMAFTKVTDVGAITKIVGRFERKLTISTPATQTFEIQYRSPVAGSAVADSGIIIVRAL